MLPYIWKNLFVNSNLLRKVKNQHSICLTLLNCWSPLIKQMRIWKWEFYNGWVDFELHTWELYMSTLQVELDMETVFLFVTHHTGRFFTGPTQKSSKYGTGPPQYKKMTKFIKDNNISTKKVKVQVRACQTLIFLLTYSKKWRSDRLWHGLSLF